MANAISDYMKNWLNTTYEYLQKTGGPTYPPSPVRTVGPNILPIGGYSLVEDTGVSYSIPITQYGTVPLPFNPGATGIPATANSQPDANDELAKANPTPSILSSNFQRIYGSSMKACIDDQTWGLMGKNPDPSGACNLFAQMGDPSLMLLSSSRQKLIGITISQENDKSDVIRIDEKNGSLTGQIGAGAQNLVAGVNTLIDRSKKGGAAPGGGADPMENPEDGNFTDFGKRISGLIPALPEIPGFPDLGENTDLIVMAAGAALVLVLLVLVFK